MVTMLGSRRERAKVTWQQRLAGVVIAIFLVIQVPIYRFDVEYDDGSLRQLHLGPLETTCLGLLKTQPQHHEQIAKLLVPGLWFKRFLNQFDACYVNPSIETSCNWKSLVERSLYDELLKEADYRDKVEVFVQQFGSYRQFAQAAAGMASVFSLSSIFLDGTVGLLVGYGGLAWLANRTGCHIMGGTVISVAMSIGAYILMAKDPKADAKPELAQAAANASTQLREREAAGAGAGAAKKDKGTHEGKKKK